MSQMDAQSSMPMMSFPGAIGQCLRRYVGFSGRATRAEYWWWTLATTACVVLLGILGTMVPMLYAVEVLFALAIILPTLAVTARRLHDIGKSGWWILAWIFVGGVSSTIAAIGAALAFGLAFLDAFLGDGGLAAIGYVVLIVGLVPTVAIYIWIIAWLARQGNAGPNRHGEDPRSI